MKVIYKIIAGMLAAVMCFSAASCDSAKKKNNIEVWAAHASDKILQDKKADDSLKESKLAILAVANEYESGQIVMTPEKSIGKYDIALSDLVTEGGEKYLKENIKVFNQKYIDVISASAGFSAGMGAYPDALLPFETAKAYGENTVAAGQNQAIRLEFYVPAEQEEGLYTGSFTITADGYDYTVPAELTVLNYTLTDEVTAKSCFLLSRHYMSRGGDDTMEAYERYYEIMLDYRIAAMYLPALIEDLDGYIASAKKYAVREDCPSYAIPTFEMANQERGDTEINYDKLFDYIVAFAEESIKSGIDLISKSYIYIGIIDEPDIQGSAIVARAVSVGEGVNIVRERAAVYLENSNISGESRQQIIDKVREIPHIVTNKYTDELYNNGDSIQNFCPLFDDFNSATNRQKYMDLYENEGYEYWWYGCIGPNYPYPTYQIDDYLLSSRVVSWMQKDYGVFGNLYWDVVFWVKYVNGERLQLEDPYQDPMHFPNDNGDGTLFYPGKPYGLDDFVSTVRVESVRDGLEEYEILKRIEDKYTVSGASSNAILQSLYTMLYSDAQMLTTSSKLFAKTREQMYRVAVLADRFDVLITDIVYSGTSISYLLKAAKDTEIILGGEKLSHTGEIGGYYTYECRFAMDKDTNALNLTAKRDGKAADLNIDLGGKKQVLNDIETDGDLAKFAAVNGSLSLVDGQVIGLSGKVLKVDLNYALSSVQSFTYTDSKLSLLSSGATTLELVVYNPGGSVEIVISVSTENDTVRKNIYSGTLQSGYQVISVKYLDQLDWQKLGGVKYLQFSIGKRNDAGRTIYVDDLIIQS